MLIQDGDAGSIIGDITPRRDGEGGTEENQITDNPWVRILACLTRNLPRGKRPAVIEINPSDQGTQIWLRTKTDTTICYDLPSFAYNPLARLVEDLAANRPAAKPVTSKTIIIRLNEQDYIFGSEFLLNALATKQTPRLTWLGSDD